MIYSFTLASVISLLQLSEALPLSNMELRVQLLDDQKEEDAHLRPQRLELPPNVDLTGVWYHVNQGDLELAQIEIDRLRDRFLNWEPPNAVVATIHARTLFQSGHLQLAEQYLVGPDANAGLRQELSELLAARALSQAKLGYWTHVWELGARAETFGTMAWNELGWIALDSGKAEVGLKYFENSMGSPNEPNALRGQLRSLLALGELIEAENLAKRIGEFDSVSSELAGLYASRALTAAHQQEWNDASTFAEAAGRLESPVWVAIGWIALENNRPDIALNFVEDRMLGTDTLEVTQLRSLALGILGQPVDPKNALQQ